MRQKWIIEIISGLFIILFLYTALSKFMDYTTFRNGIGGVIPLQKYSNILAILVPSVELVVVGLLFFPRTRKAGLYASALLMTTFTIYITYMLYFTPYRPCSCGGAIEALTWKQHLAFNIFFTILSFIGIWLHSRKSRTHSPIKSAKFKTT